MKKPIVFILEEKVYKSSLLFIGDCDADRMKKIAARWLPGLDAGDYDASDIGSTFSAKNKDGSRAFWVVWVKNASGKGMDLVESVGVLSHEIHHLVGRILQAKGVETDATVRRRYSPDAVIADEPGAYLTEFYMYYILSKITKLTKK